MATVMIVDDSAVDRQFAARLLDKVGIHVIEAIDGLEALSKIAEQSPDLVLTDLQMPKMNGLELVKEIHRGEAAIPVVLMTAFGSEETAVKALESGAASYVPKDQLAVDLVTTVRGILEVSLAKREERMSLDSMTRIEANYVLGNTVEGLNALIGQVKEQLKQMRLLEGNQILQVSIGLYEAIVNAIEHGNLELESAQRNQNVPYYRRIVEARGQEPRYRNRHVYVTVCITRSQAEFKVRDEGVGFNPALLADPTHPENVAKSEGRGLFLIRTFMDEVSFNSSGNEITMIKRRSGK